MTFGLRSSQPPVETPISTLVIPKWGSTWDPVHSSALLEICSLYKIEHLIFADESLDPKLLWNFAAYADHSPKSFSSDFLYNLKTIRCERGGIHPALKCVLHNCRVSRIDWYFVGSTDLMFRQDIKNVFDGFNLNVRSVFESNYSVRKLAFKALVLGEGQRYWPSEYSHSEDKGTALHSSLIHMTRDTVDPWLMSNRMNFLKCQKAITILLGLIKQKAFRVDPNVLKIVVAMIWETRGTKVWSI